MSIQFHIGQKVVCIKGYNYSPNTIDGWCAKTGGVYTVRAIYKGNLRVDLILEEYVHNEYHPDGSELGWDSSHFKPVIERKTDISIFTAMLNKPTVRVPA